MKKIALINQYGSTLNESGYRRTHFIGEFLAQNGFDVDFIIGSFNHWEKAQRAADAFLGEDLPYIPIVLKAASYKKNISIKRLIGLNTFAHSLKAYLKDNGEQYDLFVSAVPSYKAGLVIAKYAKKHNKPYIIDLNDLWPEAMRTVLKNKFLYKLFTFPLKRDAEKLYKQVDGVIGTSDTYRDRPFLHNDNDALRTTVYVGTDIEYFDLCVDKNLNTINKPTDEFWIIYTGTLGTSYDITTLMKAGGILAKKGYSQIKIKILGGGPLKEKFMEEATKFGAFVDFEGYMPYEIMVAYLKHSDVTLNSLVRNASQSIVNKVMDYMAAGIPIINTGLDHEFRQLIESENAGINIAPENEEELVSAILLLYNDKNKAVEMGKNARRVAEEKFDRKRSYKRICDMVNSLLERGHRDVAD